MKDLALLLAMSPSHVFVQRLSIVLADSFLLLFQRLHLSVFPFYSASLSDVSVIRRVTATSTLGAMAPSSEAAAT